VIKKNCWPSFSHLPSDPRHPSFFNQQKYDKNWDLIAPLLFGGLHGHLHGG
jgi:hypothetical protein